MSKLITSIDGLFEQLPSIYIETLSRRAFGEVNSTNTRRIKSWRSGQLKDPLMNEKITVAAKKMIKDAKKEIQSI